MLQRTRRGVLASAPPACRATPRRVWLSSGIALAALALCAGCATQAELRTVRNEEREIRALLADTQATVDTLKRQVESLRSQAESRRGSQAMASPEVDRRLAELEARIAFLEQGRTPPPSTAPSPAPLGEMGMMPTPTATVSETGDVTLAREEAALQTAAVEPTFRDAFQLMRRGDYDKAIPQFREFLYRNPKSDYADNAQYWIGYSYYQQKDYNRSILALNDVLSKYSKSEKIPATLLLQASAFAALGDHVSKVDARLILQKLVSEYPNSEEAERARQKLKTLGD